MEQPFSAINALPLSLLNLAEWQETYWNWYYDPFGKFIVDLNQVIV